MLHINYCYRKKERLCCTVKYTVLLTRGDIFWQAACEGVCFFEELKFAPDDPDAFFVNDFVEKHTLFLKLNSHNFYQG